MRTDESHLRDEFMNLMERAGVVTIVSDTVQRYKGVDYHRDSDTNDYVSRVGGEKSKLHIVVATDKKGKAPSKGEIVHHLDGCKDNNRGPNLDYMPHGEHSRITNEK
jgi:hypothetical protein